MNFNTQLQTLQNKPRTIKCDCCGKEIVTIARLQKRCKPCGIAINNQRGKERYRRLTA